MSMYCGSHNTKRTGAGADDLALEPNKDANGSNNEHAAAVAVVCAGVHGLALEPNKDANGSNNERAIAVVCAGVHGLALEPKKDANESNNEHAGDVAVVCAGVHCLALEPKKDANRSNSDRAGAVAVVGAGAVEPNKDANGSRKGNTNKLKFDANCSNNKRAGPVAVLGDGDGAVVLTLETSKDAKGNTEMMPLDDCFNNKAAVAAGVGICAGAGAEDLTLKIIKDGNGSLAGNNVFDFITTPFDTRKAFQLLSQTVEFNKAKHVEVYRDTVLNEVKFQTLLANKILYMPCKKNFDTLFFRVDVAPDASISRMKNAIFARGGRKFRTKITLETNVKLDMIVLASVFVSRDGYRIGRGNGSYEAYICLMIELGVITADTVIVTIVSDYQVRKSGKDLKKLSYKQDTLIDMIITPNQVIRVDKKKCPRPEGIRWNLMSKYFLKMFPMLRKIKKFKKLFEEVVKQKNEPPTSKKLAADVNGQKLSANTARKSTLNSKQRQNQKSVQGFCVKLTNLPRYMRIKDLKNELKKRQVRPMSIHWRGRVGFLNFRNRNGTATTQEDVEKVLNSLKNLTLTIIVNRNHNEATQTAANATTKTFKINFELLSKTLCKRNVVLGRK